MSINPNQPIVCPQGCKQYVFANMSKAGAPYYTQTPKQPTGKPEFHNCPNYTPQQGIPLTGNVGSNQAMPTLAPDPFPIQAQPLQPPPPQSLDKFTQQAGQDLQSVGAVAPYQQPQPESQPVQEGWNELIHGSLKTISLHLAEIKNILTTFKGDNALGLEVLNNTMNDFGVSSEEWEALFTKVAELATGKTKEIKKKKMSDS